MVNTAGQPAVHLPRRSLRTSLRVLLTILAGLGLCIYPICTEAALQGQVDRTAIRDGDSFTLTLDYDGAAAAPDLSVLQQGFQVLSTAQSNQVQISNGRISRQRSVQLRLRPKHIGRVTIPPLRWGSDTTTAISITVSDAPAGHAGPGAQSVTDAAQAARFEGRTTPAKAYVQAQLTYTRRLLYNGNAELHGDLPDLPDIPGAIVQPLAAPAPDSTEIGGVAYGVYEQRFAIFPQASGELVIPAVSVDANVGVSGGARIHARIASQPVHVQILPMPANYPATAAWLPAQHLQLDERWTLPQHMEVGQPIRRTVRISSAGLSNSVLPVLPWEAIAGTRFYDEPAVEQESTDGEFITGSRTQQFTWIPTRPGSITLPGVEILWWDVNAGSVQRATLPQRTFNVLGSAALPDPHTTSPLEAPSTAVARGPQWLNSIRSAPVGGLIAAIMCLAVVSLLWWSGRAVVRAIDRSRQARTRRLGSPAALAAKHWSLLADACRTNDARAAHRAFTEWLALQTTAPILRHSAFVQQLRAMSYPTADAADTQLSHAAARADQTWNGSQFWDALVAQQAGPAVRATLHVSLWARLRTVLRHRAVELPPLYPEPTQAVPVSTATS